MEIVNRALNVMGGWIMHTFEKRIWNPMLNHQVIVYSVLALIMIIGFIF